MTEKKSSNGVIILFIGIAVSGAFIWFNPMAARGIIGTNTVVHILTARARQAKNAGDFTLADELKEQARELRHEQGQFYYPDLEN